MPKKNTVRNQGAQQKLRNELERAVHSGLAHTLQHGCWAAGLRHLTAPSSSGSGLLRERRTLRIPCRLAFATASATRAQWHIVDTPFMMLRR